MHIRSFAALRWVLLCGLGLLLAAAAAVAAPETTVRTLTQALVVEEQPLGGAPQAVNREITLPDEWSRSRPGFEGSMRYQLQFDVLDSPAEVPQALYIERICSTADVRLNGELIASSGPMKPPYRRNCYHPLLVMLPAGLLYERGNTLEIQLAGHPLAQVAARQRASGLSAPLVGAHQVLLDMHDNQLFWKITMAQISSVTTVLLGLLMLALSWKRPNEKAYWYFGLTLLGWAALNARLWVREMPFEAAPAYVEATIGAAFSLVVYWGARFLLHYGGLERPRLEMTLKWQCALVPLSFLGAGSGQVFSTAIAWYSIYVVELAVVALIYLKHLCFEKQRRLTDFVLTAGLLFIVLFFMGQEAAVQYQWKDLPSIHPVHFATPLLFLMIGHRLVRRFKQALKAAETARDELEQRVAEKSAEIERNYEELAEARMEQVAEAERKRIAGDLHDDLGAKLLTIVHTSENDRIATLAREALDEMRLSVRGLTGRPVRVADALADWRIESMERLNQAHVELHWSGVGEDNGRTMSARAYVQTTRILREAINNILKHSGASKVDIHCEADETDFSLVIQDNGRGIPVEVDGRLDRGHGMAGMKRRAKALAGQCLVESSSGHGTVLRLTLPL